MRELLFIGVRWIGNLKYERCIPETEDEDSAKGGLIQFGGLFTKDF